MRRQIFSYYLLPQPLMIMVLKTAVKPEKKETLMSAIHWFEIPVSDIERACKFYGTILNTDIGFMDLTETMGTLVAMLPNRGGAGGALVQGEPVGYVPSQQGTLVYLVVDGDLDDALSKVGNAGGQILLPKTSLGEADPGFVSWISDSEGNKVGLYSTE